MKIKKKKFNVGAKLVLEITIPILADDFTDAVEQSKGLCEKDFVTMHGDYMDGAMQITSIYKDHEWPSREE